MNVKRYALIILGILFILISILFSYTYYLSSLVVLAPGFIITGILNLIFKRKIKWYFQILLIIVITTAIIIYTMSIPLKVGI